MDINKLVVYWQGCLLDCAFMRFFTNDFTTLKSRSKF